MLDLKQIRENPEAVKRAIVEKRVSLDLEALLAADQHALGLSRTLQELQEKRNHNAKLMPKASATERPRLATHRGRRVCHRKPMAAPK
jgi:seryl-tRNA synthetase